MVQACHPRRLALTSLVFSSADWLPQGHVTSHASVVCALALVRRLDLWSYHLVSRGLSMLALSVLVGAGHDALPACAEVHLRTCAVCRSGVLAVPVRCSLR